MTQSTFRSAIITSVLALVLVTPADPFTSGELIGISAADGDGLAVAVPWYRNTFVEVRASGTDSVEFPTRDTLKLVSAMHEPAPQPAPAEVQVPGPVKNLRRADAR